MSRSRAVASLWIDPLHLSMKTALLMLACALLVACGDDGLFVRPDGGTSTGSDSSVSTATQDAGSAEGGPIVARPDGETPNPPSPTDGCGLAGARTGVWQESIDVPGVGMRGFHVSIPEPYDSSIPHRLYLAVHGTGWSGEMIRPYFNIEDVAGGDGRELFVYPDRDPGTSNLETTGTQATADLSYFDAVLQNIQSRYCVDAERVFAMGHSGGGNWVTYLSCHRGSVLRAVVPTGTGGAWWYDGLSTGDVSGCQGPVAAMVVHGRRDAIIPYDPWGLETIDYFRTLNGCGSETGAPYPGTDCRSMGGCNDSFDCSHDELTDFGDGHQIPSWYRTGVMNWLRTL